MRSQVAFSILLVLLIQLSITNEITVQEAPMNYSSADSSEIVYATTLAEAVYNEVSEASYTELVRELTVNGSRRYGSDQNENAMNWIIQKLDELSSSRIETEIVGSYNSVLGKLPGTLGDGGPSVIIGGHYDTVDNAPGANDDGTGVAAALELVRVFSNYEWPLDILFGFWNAEEIGLYGSTQVANILAQNETDILVYFNIDMLLIQDFNLPSDERIQMIYYNGPGSIFQDSQYWAEMTRAMNNNFGTPIINPRPYSIVQYWPYSDHYSFQQTGYKSVIFATETGLDPYYHTDEDTWNNPAYDYGIATDTVSSIGASIAHVLSRTEGQEVYDKYSTTLLPGNDDEYLIEISALTNLEILLNWTGGSELRSEILDVDNTILEESSGSVDGTSLSDIETEHFGLYKVYIKNNDVSTITIDLEFRYEADVEGNNILDSEQNWYNGFDVDHDQDGISDAQEELLSTNRFNEDSDSDGISDYDEQYVWRTNPRLNDTDFDEMSDAYEIANGLNPRTPDGGTDLDGDSLKNYEEYLLGTAANNSDTDFDGLPDPWEVAYGLNPLVDDSLLDADGDLLSNAEEFAMGLNPMVADNPFIIVVPSISILIVLGIFIVRKRKIKP